LYIVTGPPYRPVLFCWLSSVVVLYRSSVMLPAGGPAGRWESGNAAWEHCWLLGCPATEHMDDRRAGGGRVGGRATDIVWRASRVTSHQGDTLL